jgi:hypothetical protein
MRRYVIRLVLLAAAMALAIGMTGASAATSPGSLSFTNTALLTPDGNSEPAIAIAHNGGMAITGLSWLEFGTNLWTGQFGSMPTLRGKIDTALQQPGKRVFGGGDADGLPARGQLGQRLQALRDSGQLEMRQAFAIHALQEAHGRITVLDAAGNSIGAIDEIVCATGARPDLWMTRELRTRHDPWLESTDALAPLIDPNEHSCGTVRPHGHRELAHPEAGYYAVGAKSYGRAPNFLLATGSEQVRSVVAALAGDLLAADDVQLDLPETGVCNTRRVYQQPASSCCTVKAADATCC